MEDVACPPRILACFGPVCVPSPRPLRRGRPELRRGHTESRASQLWSAHPAVSQTKKIFKAADADGNGALDIEEVGEMMANMLGRPLGSAELTAVQKEMDADGDGLVDLAEFRAWVVGPSGTRLLGAAAAAAAASTRDMCTELPIMMAESGAKSLAEAEASRGGEADPDFNVPPEVERTASCVFLHHPATCCVAYRCDRADWFVLCLAGLDHGTVDA